MNLIVDASVGVKWVFEEDGFERARALLDDGYRRIVPDLFYSEVANAVWKRVRRKDITPVDAVDALDVLFRIPTEQHESKSLLPHALGLACVHDRSVYDSLYLALALREEAAMVTADLRLFNALKESDLGGSIRWIADPAL